MADLNQRLSYAIKNFPVIEDSPRDLFRDSIVKIHHLQSRNEVLEEKIIRLQDENSILRREFNLQLANNNRINELLIGIHNDKNSN